MNNSPPNLDELWRDFTRRLNRLFNRKRLNQRGIGPGRFGRGANWRYYGTGAIFALLTTWLASGIYLVPQGQVSVILQFGQYDKTTSAGLQWRLPYPFQSHEIVNLSKIYSVKIGSDRPTRSANAQRSLLFTKEGDLIDLHFTVHYRVIDARAFLFNHVDSHENVTQVAQIAARTTVAQHNIDDMLAISSHAKQHEVSAQIGQRKRAPQAQSDEGAPQLSQSKKLFSFRDSTQQIAAELAQTIQTILNSTHTGVYVTNVSLENVAPPESVKSAFDKAKKAIQQRERQKTEAQADADEIFSSAHLTAEQMVVDAENYNQRVIAEAQGNIQHFKQMLAQYKKAPAATREQMDWNAMAQVYKNSKKILVENSKVINNLIILPSDKLIEQMKLPHRPAINENVNANENANSKASVPSNNIGSGSSSSNNNNNDNDNDNDANPSKSLPSGHDGGMRSHDLSRSRER